VPAQRSGFPWLGIWPVIPLRNSPLGFLELPCTSVVLHPWTRRGAGKVFELRQVGIKRVELAERLRIIDRKPPKPPPAGVVRQCIAPSPVLCLIDGKLPARLTRVVDAQNPNGAWVLSWNGNPVRFAVGRVAVEDPPGVWLSQRKAKLHRA